MVEKRQPWMRFYTADWRGDAELRAVGYAARGLWIDMLSLMHEATPYGHLVLNGKPLDAARLAARLGGNAKEVEQLLQRLEAEAVFSRTADGAIYSRRMVNDAEKAERDRVNGKGGGNPALTKPAKEKATDNGGDTGGVNPQDNPSDNQDDNAHARAAGARPLPESREQKEDRSLRSLPQNVAGDFDDWWETYPRKVGKDAARKAYAAALRRNVTPAVLCQALAMQRWPADPQFIPHPATWLNGGRWQDDPGAAAPPQQPHVHMPRRETYSEERRRKLGIDSMFDDLNPPALDEETHHARLPH